MPTTIVHRRCPLCHRDNSSTPALPASVDRWLLKQCPQCDFVYLENAAAYEEMTAKFAWEKTSKEEKVRRARAEPVVDKVSATVKQARRQFFKRDKLGKLLSRHLPRSGTVVDIGCADGGVLRSLPGSYTKIGIEISEKLARKAVRKTPEARIIHSDGISGLRKLSDNAVVGVVLSAILEHEIEPRMLMFECARVLTNAGVVIVKVPNYGCWNRRVRGARWCGYRFPDHVNYFTPATLSQLMDSAGLEAVQFSIFDRIPTNDNMWSVWRKKRQLPLAPVACIDLRLAVSGGGAL